MAKHCDASAEDLDRSPYDRVDEFETFNADATDDDVVISHPERDGDVDYRRPLIRAMARDARARKSGCRKRDNNWSVDKIFDEGICDIADTELDAVGLNEGTVKQYKLRSLLILVARDLDSFGELHDHLSQYSTDELDRLGLNDAMSRSTYRKAAKKLKNNDTYELLKEASRNAVDTLYRHGYEFPEAVKQKYDVSYERQTAGSAYSLQTRQYALYDTVKRLLDLIIEQFDSHSDDIGIPDVKSLIGILAHSAYNGRSAEYYEETTQHTFDISAPAWSTYRRHLDTLKVWQVTKLFNDINQALLDYVLSSGVFEGPVDVSYDLTDIETLGREVVDERFVTKDGRWRFASLSITDSNLEFSVCFQLLKSEAQRARDLQKFLRKVTSLVDVRFLFCDRGFDGVEDIEACRAYVPYGWFRHAQDNSDDSRAANDYDKFLEKIEPGGTAVVQNAGFNDLYPPAKLIGYSEADEDGDGHDQLRAFYTDHNLPEDDENRARVIGEINSRYDQRAKIETLFRLIKNILGVSTDTDKPARKAFYLQTSVLFYNLYKAVKTIPSPTHGVEFDISQQEFLEALRIIAFGGPTTPDPLSRVLDEQ